MIVFTRVWGWSVRPTTARTMDVKKLSASEILVPLSQLRDLKLERNNVLEGAVDNKERGGPFFWVVATLPGSKFTNSFSLHVSQEIVYFHADSVSMLRRAPCCAPRDQHG